MSELNGVFQRILFTAIVFTLSGVFAFGTGAPAQTLNLPEAESNIAIDDDYVPEFCHSPVKSMKLIG